MKGIFRKKMLALRDSLPQEDRKKKSLEIGKKLFSLPEFQKAKTVLFYASFRSEVETENLIKESLKTGKTILVPKVQGSQMQLCELKDFDKELSASKLGIPEPKNEFTRLASANSLDLIIAPGIAFDLKGNRLGYGKGFYDRFLKTLDKIPIIALAFDIQLVEELPAEEHDKKINTLITETKILKF